MVGLGETLQRARHDQRLTLEQVEEAIRIRTRYLAALEAERFDVLPGGAYARVFTREYAHFLGLDPAPLLDQLADDLADQEPAPTMLVQQRSGGLLARYWIGIAIAAVIVGVIAWSMSRGSGQTPPPAAVTTPTTTSHVATLRPTTRAVAPRPLPPPRIALAAARGDCWLSVHLGSSTGATLWEGTLPRGRTLHFTRRTLWIRAGAPSSLDLRVNGRPVALPPGTGGPVNLVVTRSGARTA
jgi:transcriptional regulator with XRE-family HTH domain